MVSALDVGSMNECLVLVWTTGMHHGVERIDAGYQPRTNEGHFDGFFAGCDFRGSATSLFPLFLAREIGQCHAWMYPPPRSVSVRLP